MNSNHNHEQIPNPNFSDHQKSYLYTYWDGHHSKTRLLKLESPTLTFLTTDKRIYTLVEMNSTETLTR